MGFSGFHFWLAALLWVAALVAPATSTAAPAFTGGASQVDLAGRIAYIEDPEHRLTLADVSAAAASRFVPWTGRGDFNVSHSDSSYWLRVGLDAALPGAEQRLLEIAYAYLAQIDFYAPGQPVVHTGQAAPFEQRAWPHRFFVFPVTLAAEPQFYYFHIRSGSPITVPLTLWTPPAFAAASQTTYVVQSLYFGEVLTLMAYNLLIFLSLKERVFLSYSVFSGATALAILFGSGLGQQYVWPAALAWSDSVPVMLYCVAGAAMLGFSRSFLHTVSCLPRLDRWLRLAWVSFLALAAGLLLGAPVRTVWPLMNLVSLASVGLIISAGILAVRQGNKSARYFLLAWGCLELGLIVVALRSFGVIPTTLLTGNALQLSSATEMLLLSFALADRIRQERNARAAAQADSLAARQLLVESLRTSEAQLETTVMERTAELNKSLHNERSILERYIRFGAFVAHEFRNPLAIIKSQLALAGKERSRGIDRLDQRIASAISAANRLGVLVANWLDSDRLRHHAPVLALSAFALSPWLANLVQESRSQHSQHTFTLDLPQAMPLPVLKGDEPMLRMALINLLDNAAKYAPVGTCIAVEAAVHEGHVRIAVMDHGPGIAKAHHEAVFSDYFRCDPTGPIPGLGLGLAVVQKVAELHGGRVELTSERGQGCRFCICLPLPGCTEEKAGTYA